MTLIREATQIQPRAVNVVDGTAAEEELLREGTPKQITRVGCCGW